MLRIFCLVLLITFVGRQPAVAAQLEPLQRLLERVERVKAKLASQQSERKVARIKVGTELFLSTYKGNLYLGEVIALTSEQGVNIELLSLFSALGFVVTENDSGHFDGWFFAPEQTFHLDPMTRQVESRGRQIKLDQTELQVINGEVFLADYVIATLFDVSVYPNTRELSLTVTSEEMLPIEAKHQRMSREVARYDRNASATLPWRPSPYQNLGKPVLDAQVNTQITKGEDRTSYSVIGAQDIAYWQAKYFISGREEDLISRSRISLNRASADAKALPFGDFTSVAVGDVQSVQIGADALIEEGRGITFSNAPLYKTLNRQRIVISGPVQAGWDVELYRNGLLIGQQNNVQVGRYEFENVDLLSGENTFELVMYGGQGQVSKEIQTYYVEQGVAKKGESFFAVSVTEAGKSVLGDKLAQQGSSSWQVNGRFDYGLSADLAVYAGVQHKQGTSEDPAKQVYSLGFNTNINKLVLLDVDYRKEDAIQALAMNTRTRLFGQQVAANIEMQRDADLNKNATEVKLTAAGAWSFFQLPQLYYRAEYLYLDNFDDKRAEQASLLFSSGNYWGTFSNQFVWQDSAADAADISGYARWQRRIFGVYSRFTAWYDIKPENEITAAEIEFSKDVGEDFDLGITFYKDFAEDYHKSELGLSWNHDKFRLLSDVQLDSNDDWQVGLSGQFSIGAGKTPEHVFMSAKRLSQSGSLMIHAFIDQNNNGHRDEGERSLPGVTVRALQNYAQGKTDDEGIALLPAMANYKKTDIVVDQDSIPDPFLIPANDGFSFTPRPGFIEYIEIPFVNSSEIEGFVEVKEGKQKQPAGFTTVNLVDKSGKTVAQTQTAYDGYYVFTGLKPGTYRTQISDAKRLAMAANEQVEVELSPKGDVLLDVNLELQRLQSKSKEVAIAGRFNTLSILKVYAAILAKRYPSVLDSGFGYAQKQGEQMYLLVLRANQGHSAARICQALQPYKVTCTVEDLIIYEREQNAKN
ncbi:SdrD B-like domain-containing protein [Pseudoalteromonas piscicida]|uniref:SdrD B-like domain-containing protein n=1 Tax=Pseudoalteromonas piscicida TaxID=43662 RepID=UPI0030A2972D